MKITQERRTVMTVMTTITTGKVSGRTMDGVTAFTGIPFAKSPFGPLRFGAPAPVEPWEGTFDATRFGPIPPQGPSLPGMSQWRPADGLDCLTVNVWSPDPGGGGLPVMVWIYGGAYVTGGSSSPDYDGARLAGEGVVVVSFNYRVGFEGYAQVEGAPANRALLDQLAALRWVRDNIAAFGGDPGNVTIFGESAGAGSVACLMAMPSASGLFHRAIAQSVPSVTYTPALAARVSAAIMRGVGGSPYDSDPEQLVAASSTFVHRELVGDVATWGPLGISAVPFAPVVDGEVLPDTPWNALADGASGDVELIVGFNRDEFKLFQALADGRPGDVRPALETAAPSGADLVYRGEDAYAALMSDWLFRMPSALLADAHTGTTFCYELTWEPTALGACHGLDVHLTFGNLGTPLAVMLTGGSPEAEGLSAQFRTAWTRFATTGDPGWPQYEPKAAITHLFDVESADAPDPEAASRALWSTSGFPVTD
ncbi:carboxylesterase/lipase family protein [Streptosporangium sp. NPDC000396]|uniref:carboxylesterase/lipase family protein n=1 Tax=Streptosporangium sp. NPDC000396 TaxID=3366185 RepID=UPI00369A9A09